MADPDVSPDQPFSKGRFLFLQREEDARADPDPLAFAGGFFAVSGTFRIREKIVEPDDIAAVQEDGHIADVYAESCAQVQVKVRPGKWKIFVAQFTLFVAFFHEYGFPRGSTRFIKEYRTIILRILQGIFSFEFTG